MNENQFIGYAVTLLLPVLGSLIALIKPIINLNVNIQKLSDSISTLTTDSHALKKDVDKHTELLHDHETRLQLIELMEDDGK